MAKASKIVPKKAVVNNRVLAAKPVALAVKGAYARNTVSHGTMDASIKQTWESLEDISREIGQWMAQMAQDIHDSVELVKIAGCEHIQEFNAAVIKTNSDFVKFMADYEKVRAKHAGKNGFIQSPDDLALALQIFEDYNQFRAYFDGVMHHSLISFTEYALEAKDRLAAKAAEEEKQAEQSKEVPVEEVKNV